MIPILKCLLAMKKEDIILRLSNIKDSVVLNYKSWGLIFASLFLISDSSRVLYFFTFFVMMLFAHYFHKLCHYDDMYPLNITHIYHHLNNNSFSHFIQATLEFSAFLSIIVVKYLIDNDYLNMFLKWISNYLINEYVILYFYLFYTTVHNINYSIIHVNTTHESHHKLFNKNYGPDISDVLFGTTYGELENTDHYILNIIGCTAIVLAIKYVWTHTEDKSWMIYSFGGLYATLSTILGISTVGLFLFFNEDIETRAKAEENLFSHF